MTPRIFERRVLETVRATRLWPPAATLLLGVSGGADSMALLHGVHRLAQRRDTRWRPNVAHLNHGLRGPAGDADARFVERAAAQRDLPFVTERLDVRAFAAAHDLTIEEAARACRYAFLARAAERVGAAVVVVAHHADDQAETILHHILRGSGLRGLAGMPPSRPLDATGMQRLARPLLSFRRAILEHYLRAAHVAWRTDAANIDEAHTRNRIRHRLLPMIEQDFNPRVVDALLRLGEQARASSALIESMAAALLAAPRVRRRDEDDGARLFLVPAGDLVASPRIVQGEAVRQALRTLGVGLGEIGYERVAAVLHMLAGGRGGRRIQLPGGAWVTRRGKDVIFGARDASKVGRSRHNSAGSMSKTDQNRPRRRGDRPEGPDIQHPAL